MALLWNLNDRSGLCQGSLEVTSKLLQFPQWEEFSMVSKWTSHLPNEMSLGGGWPFQKDQPCNCGWGFRPRISAWPWERGGGLDTEFSHGGNYSIHHARKEGSIKPLDTEAWVNFPGWQSSCVLSPCNAGRQCILRIQKLHVWNPLSCHPLIATVSLTDSNLYLFIIIKLCS